MQQRYSYDGFDRIASETKNSGSGLITTSYTYDPFDRTVSRTDNAGSSSAKTTTYDYLATSKALVNESVGGTVTKSYQYAPTGERLDQIVHNTDGTETPTYYSYNAHSDVQAITDVNGNTKSTYGYTAYGKDDTSQDTGVDKGTGSGSSGGTTTGPYNVYRFNANRIDATTGNYDMGFRNYDPSTSRFLSRDMYDGAFADTNIRRPVHRQPVRLRRRQPAQQRRDRRSLLHRRLHQHPREGRRGPGQADHHRPARR